MALLPRKKQHAKKAKFESEGAEQARTAAHSRKMLGSSTSSRFLRLLVLCIVLAAASAGKDLYKVLGVDRGADERTLKKAYRTLAL